MRNEDWNNIFGDTPEEFHKSVNSALEKIAEREETNMSRSMGIRKIVGAAAVVAAFGGTAIAAMKAAGLESHTDLRDAVYSVSEIQELSDDEDFGVKYIDEFSNGYKFEVGYPSVGKANDADGNTIKEYTSFAVEYKRRQRYRFLYRAQRRCSRYAYGLRDSGCGRNNGIYNGRHIQIRSARLRDDRAGQGGRGFRKVYFQLRHGRGGNTERKTGNVERGKRYLHYPRTDRNIRYGRTCIDGGGSNEFIITVPAN